MDHDDSNRPSKSQRLSRSKSQRLAPAKSERLARRFDAEGARASAEHGRATGRRAALPPEPTSLVGCWIGGDRFEVGSSLRRGPLTEVYRGVDLSQAGGIADDRVTIRVVHEHLLGQPGLVQTVLATGSALCDLAHPAILRGRECDLDQEQPFLVLDHEPGKSLADVLREAEGPLPVPRALGIVRQIAQALDEAHSAGLTHQELSPSCVFLEKDPAGEGAEQVRVADFALVPPSLALDLELGVLTLNAARYASPERAAGAPQEERSDLYALGLILYECLSGQLPFQGFFADQVLKARIGQRIPSISERVPEAELPVALIDVLERVLSPDLNDRYSSARGLLKALDAAEEAAAAEASLPPPTPLEVVEELPLPGLDASAQVSLTREDSGLGLTWVVQTPRRRPADLSAFEDALAAAGEVQHPGLAPLESYGPRGPRELIARSLWQGASAAESAQAQIERGPLEEVALVRRLRPVLEGLAAAHAAGISHGMIDPRLVEFGRHPRLHGLGVVPAARAIPSLTTVDVRDLAFLMLQLLAGVPLEEAGLEGVREQGLAKARGKVREVLQTATSSSPYPNVGVVLEVLDQDPRLQRKSPVPYVVGGLVVLLLVAGLAYLISPGGEGPPATPSATQAPTSVPSATPTPSVAPSRPAPPTPTPEPSPEPTPSPEPSASPEPGPTPAERPAPEWFAALAEAERPALPLPGGLEFGDRAGTYLLVRDGSVLVWVPEAKAFVGKFEVTWEQYRRYAEASGVLFPEEAFAVARDHPVHNVSWKDARAYAEWAGARLPSSAEWQAAAGGGPWPWGDQSPDATYANLNGDEDGYPHTSPVGSFPRGVSPRGCEDLAGNVAEWIADRQGRERGVRGGGWFSHAWDTRVAWRGHAAPGRRFDFVGFRLALSPK